MLNPDRAELGLQPTSVCENSKESVHIPRWLRVPTFTTRTFLAILTAELCKNTELAIIGIGYAKGPSDPPSPKPEPTKIPTPDAKATARVIPTLRPAGQPAPSATKRPEATATPTSNATATAEFERQTGLATRQAQGTAIAEEVRRAVARELAAIQGTAIAEARRPTLTSTPIPTSTPTLTPTHTSTPEATGTLTPTLTSTPIPGIVEPERPESYRRNWPWEWIIGIPTVLGAAGAVFLWGWNRWVGRTLHNIPPSYSGVASGVGPVRGALGGGPNPNTAPGSGVVSRLGTIIGVLSGSRNPNTAPNFGPVQTKNPEWIIGQQEFEKRWQDAKGNFSPVKPGETGNEPEHILDRFKTAMNIVHEVSLDHTIGVPTMAMRVRAGIEYLIPQIWPDNRIFKRFFNPRFNAGFLTAESLARMIYLPEKYRNLSSLTKGQKADIQRIHRIFVSALHTDTAKVDSDKSLQESIDDLFKIFNPAWPYIDNLIK